MKKIPLLQSNEHGFALITAIMMLFAATVLGLMVMNSADIEIMLSGAQQRYEQNLNIIEGAIAAESLTNYPYPEGDDIVVSPNKSKSADFDPYNDMTADDTTAEYEVIYDRSDLDDAGKTTPVNLWPMSNLVKSGNAADDQLDYHYRTLCVKRVKSTGFGVGAAADNYDTYWQSNVYSGSNIEIGFKTTGK